MMKLELWIIISGGHSLFTQYICIYIYCNCSKIHLLDLFLSLLSSQQSPSLDGRYTSIRLIWYVHEMMLYIIKSAFNNMILMTASSSCH